MIDFELERAINLFVKEKTLLGLQEGDHLLILNDSENDLRVVEAVARVAYTVGARAIVLSYPQFPQTSGAGLYRHVEGALESSDVILELGMKRLYSPPLASKHGARYYATMGFNRDKAVRLLTGYNYPKMLAFELQLVSMTKAAKEMRITSKAGTDIHCTLDPDRPVIRTAEVGLLPGTIAWSPFEESINGRVVFDGFTLLKPMDSDIIRTPLEVEIVDGRLQKDSISGIEAERFKYYLEKWNDEKMYQVVHLTYGTIPTAQRSLDQINVGEEDERVFGTCTVGSGWQNPAFKGKSGFAASHSDGIILNASTWLDGEQIEMDGKFIHPDLVPIVENLLE
jgi:leucyl aminopeptidase (aminopeptidase T)